MSGWKDIVPKEYIDASSPDSFVRTKAFSAWEDVKVLLSKFGGNWIFRGQEDVSWGLQTSLERWALREGQSANVAFFEKIFVEEFQKGARNHLLSSIHLPENTLEWLSLMQHHGCPTRLLDFTCSQYVAAFFALENCWKNDCTVWCIERDWCKTTAVSNFNGDHEKKEDQISIDCDFADEKIFKVLFWEDSKATQMIFPAVPLHNNARIEIQQGLFLCQGSEESFSENVGAMDNYLDYIVKIVISPDARKDGIKDLNKMNVNNATLFPGLDGYARSIKNKVWIEK